ncbi:MAG: VanZ family protein [Planctomycetales bacterium]|nr:VanZ family protein [Planctomycetales bacterium]
MYSSNYLKVTQVHARPLSTAKPLRTMIRLASLCLASYWLAIFVATHLPSTAMPALRSSDKICHGIAFAGLSFLLAWALPKRTAPLKHLGWAAVLALGYGCVDEFTQNFIPGRTCDIWDVAADAVGVACGLLLYLIARQLLIQHRLGRRLIQSLAR